MAGGASFSSSTTCMTLFFSLLLAFQFAMAVPKSTFFTPLTSTKDNGAKKRNDMMVAASAREGATQNTKIDMTPKQTTKDIDAPDLLRGPKGGPSRASRPSLQWQNKIFNASEHEVPSGPNPISNR